MLQRDAHGTFMKQLALLSFSLVTELATLCWGSCVSCAASEASAGAILPAGGSIRLWQGNICTFQLGKCSGFSTCGIMSKGLEWVKRVPYHISGVNVALSEMCVDVGGAGFGQNNIVVDKYIKQNRMVKVLKPRLEPIEEVSRCLIFAVDWWKVERRSSQSGWLKKVFERSGLFWKFFVGTLLVTWHPKMCIANSHDNSPIWWLKSILVGFDDQRRRMYSEERTETSWLRQASRATG